ncbi:MAG TPA: hypothetical protein VMP01_11740 [Pirellulaceae bacterium]|nr:hypothetical protein [Pirellulaceae bacterium]
MATTFVAVGCYALRWASPWWAIVLFYTGLALIVAGILIAFNRGGETRSFWGGFSICGMAHMLLVFHPGLSNGIPSLHPAAFVTTWMSAWTYQSARPKLSVQPRALDFATFQQTRGRPGGDFVGRPLHHVFKAGEDGHFYTYLSRTGPHYILEQDFIEVAHGLWTLLLAYIGGCVSLAIYRTRPRD